VQEAIWLVVDKNGIQVEVLQTEAAVERFNVLRENTAVGGLFHFDLLSDGRAS
jgi:hypothetical protein